MFPKVRQEAEVRSDLVDHLVNWHPVLFLEVILDVMQPLFEVNLPVAFARLLGIELPIAEPAYAFRREFISIMKASRKRRLADTQYKIWYDIMQEYSGQSITFSDDRLPALAGIATELARV